MDAQLEERLNGMVINNKGACIILFKGQQIKLPSGKVVWAKVGHAKNAWSNAFGNRAAQRYGYKDAKDLRNDLMSKGILQFKIL